MEFWKTKTFRLQLKVWNQKLKDSDFEDAETDAKGERTLKQRVRNVYWRASELERETRMRYYSLLGHLANNTEFSSDVDSFIMQRHADGATALEIAQALEKEKQIKKSRRFVDYTIKRWQMKWGVRRWTAKQVNLKKGVI